MDSIYTFSREVISRQVTTMLTTILHDTACWLWAVSQVNDEYHNLPFPFSVFFSLYATRQTEPSNIPLAHQVCVKNNWYLAFRCKRLFCSKYSCLHVCLTRLPRRGWDKCTPYSLRPKTHKFISFLFFCPWYTVFILPGLLKLIEPTLSQQGFVVHQSVKIYGRSPRGWGAINQ